MTDNFLTTLRASHLAGNAGGLLVVCSSHGAVLREAAALAKKKHKPLLVEATANQVNQDGGYSGMTPAAFADFVGAVIRTAGLSEDRVLIGADHLGPAAWPALPSGRAMEMASDLVRHCVRAGFSKIHLDTGRPCSDDDDAVVAGDVAARRAAALCRVAEKAAAAAGRQPPTYVIGDEVPPPGGALQEGRRPRIRSIDSLAAAIHRHQAAFSGAGLGEAWRRVVGVVVQPGVEFGDRTVAGYCRKTAEELSAFHRRLPGSMTFEVHAADYQCPASLARMVQDHFLLLKIGPCLTFAYREALYALADIEAALPDVSIRSNLRQVMEALMIESPSHWRSHYRGSQDDLRFLRHFSLRDRIRYYWHLPAARAAVTRLFDNLSRPVPAALLHQYLPDLWEDLVQAPVPFEPERVVSRRIRRLLEPMLDAVGSGAEATPRRRPAPPLTHGEQER